MKKLKARKYTTELVLNVYSSEPTLVHPADLDKLGDQDREIKERLRYANLYLILKRPRISFVPESIEINQRQIVGRISIDLGASKREFPFRISERLPDDVTSVSVSPYPHTKMTLHSQSGDHEQTYPTAFLLRKADIDLGGLDHQEVMYVGQAFGQAGERTAVERLSSHSTLQKILADISATEPNAEILLALYNFEYHRFLIMIDGQTPSLTSDREDDAHRDRALQARFKRSMRIGVAEAGLIRYFQPKYNKIFKTGFPHKRHRVLEKLYEFDFGALVVEISVADHGMNIFSPTRPSNRHHISRFELHDPSVRRTFFFGDP